MGKILQLKIELLEITPKIWREFLVRDSVSFQELNDIVQIIMGWEDYHMHEFSVNNNKITSEEDDFNPAEVAFKPLFDSPEFSKMVEKAILKKGSVNLDVDKLNKILKKSRKKTDKQNFTMGNKISELVKSEGQKFNYLYDFGDCWQHLITVVRILEDFDNNQKYPICIAGQRACPPEDCGGIDGYYELQEIKKNKNHHYYKEKITTWLGNGFDFEFLDLSKINKSLSKYKR